MHLPNSIDFILFNRFRVWGKGGVKIPWSGFETNSSLVVWLYLILSLDRIDDVNEYTMELSAGLWLKENPCFIHPGGK
jgi:hypothetical protein